LLFGTLGIELMISERNLRTRGESTMSFALSELPRKNYLKLVHCAEPSGRTVEVP